ncbi:UNVERIFIED_CONTAM: hypothetical protein NCL1_49109 [Trichonephila clavipes]
MEMLEAGQSQGEMARWLQVTDVTVVSQLWNRFQTSGTVIRNVGRGRHRISTSAQNRYLALSTQQNRQTKAPHSAHDFAAVFGRISKQIVYNHLAETGLCAQCPV